MHFERYKRESVVFPWKMLGSHWDMYIIGDISLLLVISGDWVTGNQSSVTWFWWALGYLHVYFSLRHQLLELGMFSVVV